MSRVLSPPPPLPQSMSSQPCAWPFLHDPHPPSSLRLDSATNQATLNGHSCVSTVNIERLWARRSWRLWKDRLIFFTEERATKWRRKWKSVCVWGGGGGRGTLGVFWWWWWRWRWRFLDIACRVTPGLSHHWPLSGTWKSHNPCFQARFQVEERSWCGRTANTQEIERTVWLSRSLILHPTRFVGFFNNDCEPIDSPCCLVFVMTLSGKAVCHSRSMWGSGFQGVFNLS